MDSTRKEKPMREVIDYQLPNGRIVAIDYDVCRAASTIDFTMADGRIVLAVICHQTKAVR